MIDTKISGRTSYQSSSTEWICDDYTYCSIGPSRGLYGIYLVITTSNETLARIESIPCSEIWSYHDFLCI